MGILVLLFLGWLASENGRPLLFGAVFAAYVAIIAVVFGAAPRAAVAGGAIGFGVSSLYFWLLSRYSDSTVLWLAILLGFPLIWTAIRLQALA